MPENNPALPEYEIKRFAWQIGMKLGSAVNAQSTALRHLEKYHEAKEKSSADVPFRDLLVSAFAMVEDYKACTELARNLGLEVPRLGQSDWFAMLFHSTNQLKEKERSWILSFVESAESPLGVSCDQLQEYFQKAGQIPTALFELAVRSALEITSPQGSAHLSRFASAAELPTASVNDFLEAVTRQADPDDLRTELARLDKLVERHLLDEMEKQA